MSYAPYARILLRYVVGAMLMGSDKIGQTLSADPDLVMITAGAIGVVVEATYAMAKRKGWVT